jgi:hypothetical protein
MSDSKTLLREAHIMAQATASPSLDREISSLVSASNPTNPSEGLPGYWTRLELARKLRKSEKTLDRMHAKRIGPPRISVGSGSERASVILYKIDEVVKWLDSQAVGPVRSCRTSRRGVSR